MKIVVTSAGETLESNVDPRFGRAAKFVLYDTQTKKIESIDNAQNLNLPQGAGIQAAATVSRLGTEVVITGHCGPKAFQTLTAANIQVVVGAAGTVNQALEQYQGGLLQVATTPDVKGHW